MVYKQPSSGSTFKELGSSPAKQVLVSDTNKKTKSTSEKIGPSESPEAIKKKRQAYNKVPLGKEYDAEYDKKRASYKESKKYRGSTEY